MSIVYLTDKDNEQVFMSGDFGEAALVGQQLCLNLLAKLVDRRVILAVDAAEILDDVLLELEEWQSSFPEYQKQFEVARAYLSTVIDGYRAM